MIFTLLLDGQKLQAYQVPNGELSVAVDRQALPPGAHTLKVHQSKKDGTGSDEQIFKFTIIDAPR
jgi:hypothetical protein